MTTQLRARHIFARNLRRFRLQLNISQEDLADLAGLHRTYISSVERGQRNISIDNMERIAIALKRPLIDLLIDRSNETTPR